MNKQRLNRNALHNFIHRGNKPPLDLSFIEEEDRDQREGFGAIAWIPLGLFSVIFIGYFIWEALR